MEINQTKLDNQVAGKTGLIAAILLAVFLLLLDWATSRFSPEASSFSRAVKTGIGLLLFWVVCTSALRSIVRLRKRIPGIKLLLVGVGVAVAGILLHQLGLQVLVWFKTTWSPAPNYKMFLFYAAGGFIAAVISLINLRVKNQKLGNFLEVLFIGLIAFLFFYFTK